MMKKLRRIMAEAQKSQIADLDGIAKRAIENLGYKLVDNKLMLNGKHVGDFNGFDIEGNPLINLKVSKKKMSEGLPPDVDSSIKSYGAVEMPHYMYLSKNQLSDNPTEFAMMFDFGAVIKY